ncbi:MAG: hypothetical protein AcusKO_34460 [Acuticoccus sp.]
MGEILAALEASGVAEWARNARWGYAMLNGTHILGVALLVGAMVPLNLLRIGLKAGVSQEAAARILVPCAAAGLCLAIATGAVMFASRAGEYAGLMVFQTKIVLIVVGTGGALVLNLWYGWRMTRARASVQRHHALWSLFLWLVVLYLGRSIAFVG